MKWYVFEVCSVEMEDEMDVERHIAAGNKVDGALAALMRRRNVSTAARLAVHNASVGTDAIIWQGNVGITEEKK